MANEFKAIPMYESIAGECKIGDKVLLTAKKHGYSIARAACRFTGIQAGQVYEITVPYSASDIDGRVQVIASWLLPDGRAAAKGYLAKVSKDTMWVRYLAPQNVGELEIEYRLWSNGGGEAEFGMPQIESKGAYVPRNVRLATAWFKSIVEGRTVEQNLADILSIADNAGSSEEKPDILVFSEAIYGRGVVDKTLRERALKLDSEPIARMREKAAKYKMYMVVGLHIDDGGLLKNVAIVIDRNGNIPHIYNKTHLTMGERASGLVSGNEFPVFDLDFGRVGILICWDHYFSEPSRILHMKGAEVIIVPTAGDTKYQCRTRAQDSGAYVVMGGTKEPSSSIIIDHYGEVVASVTDVAKGYTSVSVDLNKRQFTYWMSVGPADGESRDVYMQERRHDLFGDLAQDALFNTAE